jgi:PLP dependent protein
VFLSHTYHFTIPPCGLRQVKIHLIALSSFWGDAHNVDFNRVNSGEEPQRFGVMPEDTKELIEEILALSNLKIMGLMTMGPRFGDPEKSRPYFIKTKKLFNNLKKINLPGVEMKYLSMGMTNSYKIALEEGANIIRVGTKIFGERKEKE